MTARSSQNDNASLPFLDFPDLGVRVTQKQVVFDQDCLLIAQLVHRASRGGG